MAARPDAVAFAPFPKGLPGVSLALGQNPTGFITRVDRSPDLRRRARPAVTFDRHVALSSRSARRIERAMKSALRRGWDIKSSISGALGTIHAEKHHLPANCLIDCSASQAQMT